VVQAVADGLIKKCKAEQMRAEMKVISILS
jgi:hypothetical protein